MNHDDLQNKAKMDVLQALRQVAMELIHGRSGDADDSDGSEGPGGDPTDNMQKVMVAAKDKAGLQQGLDKAKSVLGSMPDDSDDSSDSDDDSEDGDADESHEAALHLNPENHDAAVQEEAGESPEHQADEEQELLAKLQALRAKKQMMK